MADADDAVRRQLLAHGDNGESPRHAVFYFYGGDVDALAEAAHANGFSSQPTATEHGLILEKTLAVDELSFAIVEKLMDRWAREFGADYDGWECAVLGIQ